MSEIPIGVQLYSVREETKKDYEGTLKAIADMGYEGVELVGPPKHDPEELKNMLKDLGLGLSGWHIPFPLFLEDKIEETIEYNRILGNRYLIFPNVPHEYRETTADWYKLADFFTELSEKLAQYDMYTGYHNHFVEFKPLEDGDKTPWDIVFENTPEDFIMQLDMGNAYRGGGDVISILKKYPGRAVTVHVKPYSFEAVDDNPFQGYAPLVGDDELDWEEIFTLCEDIGGTKWHIVEYENKENPPLKSVEMTLRRVEEIISQK